MKFQYRHTRNACYMGYITQAIINNLAPLLFLTFQTQFSISLEKISLLITFNFAMQMVVDILAAKYVDKIGYRCSVVAAHIFSTLGLLCLGTLPLLFKDAYLGLVIATMLNAVGGGLIEVLISPIVDSLPGKEKASAMSLLHSFYCWGHVSVVLLSTLFFVTAGVSKWYFLTLLWAIIPLCNAFFFARVPLNTITEQHEPMSIKKLFSVKLFWVFLVLMLCAGAAEQSMSQWASFFAETGLNVSKTMGDLLGPCAFALLMGLSRAFYGKFGSRINLKHFILYSGILCIFSYLLATLSHSPILALTGCALTGLSVGIMWPGSFSLASEYYPKGGTAMWAFLALGGDIGCGLGPGLVGFISNAAGGQLRTGLMFALAFPAVILILVLMLPKKQAVR